MEILGQIGSVRKPHVQRRTEKDRDRGPRQVDHSCADTITELDCPDSRALNNYGQLSFLDLIPLTERPGRSRAASTSTVPTHSPRHSDVLRPWNSSTSPSSGTNAEPTPSTSDRKPSNTRALSWSTVCLSSAPFGINMAISQSPASM